MASVQARVRSISAAPPAREAAPSYAACVRAAARASGAWVEDARGVQRADFHNADGTVLLGWNDPAVEAAVAEAAPGDTALEAEAAERLGELLPCAEAVSFSSGTPAAVADALLAAKLVTGRDGAFFCDEAATTAGDIGSLEAALGRHAGEVAALIVRPMDAPAPFLAAARRLSDLFGLVLIFDESRTAFRVHEGGAQGLTGVRPDLAICGPSLANGHPLAAVAGRMEVMTALTQGGPRPSTASLAAACATLARIEREDAAAQLRVRGAEIAAEVEARLRATGADALLAVCGDPSWSVLAGGDGDPFGPAHETLAAGLFGNAVLSFGAHIPSLAVGEAEIAHLLAAYDAVLPALVDRAAGGVRKPARR